MASTSSITSNARIRWQSIAIPPEHGAWGFLLEPILLGLSVAPSWAGLLLAFGIVGTFLVRHPLRLAMADWQRRKRYARTKAAERVMLVYSAVAVIGLVGAVALAGPEILVPFILMLPLAAIMFIGYAQNRGRDLLPELSGAAALAVTASGMALADGQSASLALALWIILNARNIPSILYVRARLRLEKEKPYSLALVLIANLIGVGSVLALIVSDLAPILSFVALLILAARAVVGLSPYRRRVRTQTIGFLEIGYGLITVILTAAGYALDL